MSSALEFPIALPAAGQKINYPQEFLAEQFSPYCRNMEFYLGRLQSRYGLTKVLSGSAALLNGAIIARPELIKFDGTRHEVFCTATDIYELDLTNSRYTILTPTYTTGTIEVQAGTPTKLRGTGTVWSSNLKAGDFVKIGAGSIHTGSTWYKVLSVDSNTLLTMTSSMPTTGAGSAYVARKTFTGGNNDIFDWVQFQDKSLGETLVMTNGVDKPLYWTGTGQVAAFATLPTGLTAAKYVSVFAERLILGWTVEGGQNQPQRIQATEPADITTWDSLAFPIDFVDEPTQIRGLAKLGNYHIVFKESNCYVGTYVGGDFILSYNLSFQCKGVRSAYSIVVRQDYVYYYGTDKKFKRFNLLQEDIISEDNFPETNQFDPNQDEFIVGYDIFRKNQIRWLCPKGSTTKMNYTFVFDYLFEKSLVWEYQDANATCSIGTILRTSDAYCDDPGLASTYVDGMEGFCDDSSFLDNAPLVVYGGYDGYLRYADNGTDDDGTSYTRVLRLKRLNFNMPDFIKRLWRQQWWLESAVAGSVTVKLMINDKTTYESGSKTISLIPDDANQDMVKRNITWDIQAQDFQTEVSSTNYFATLGCINYYFKKRSTRVA